MCKYVYIYNIYTHISYIYRNIYTYIFTYIYIYIYIKYTHIIQQLAVPEVILRKPSDHGCDLIISVTMNFVYIHIHTHILHVLLSFQIFLKDVSYVIILVFWIIISSFISIN